VLQRATASRVALRDLDHGGATWRFRTVAHNRFGVSEPSIPSEEVLPGLHATVLASPPRVHATGRTTVRIPLPRGLSCQPDLEWLIQVSVGDQGREREGEEEGARRWQVLAIARAGTTYTAEKINCAAGCAFRLQAVVSGFGPDGGSSLVTPEAVLSAADFGLPIWTAVPRERKGPSPRAEGAVSDGVGGGGASALSKLLLPLALLALAARGGSDPPSSRALLLGGGSRPPQQQSARTHSPASSPPSPLHPRLVFERTLEAVVFTAPSSPVGSRRARR